MTLMETAQLLGNFGEFVGAVAVVATLVYLIIQVRHGAKNMEENTRQMKVMAFNQHDESVGSWRMNMYTNTDLAELWLAGGRADTRFDDTQKLRFENMVVDYLQRSRTAFVAAQASGHQGQMRMTAANVANRISGSVGVRSVWERGGRRYSEMVEPAFVVAVETALEEEGEQH
jgi:hypothetical protein